MILSFDELYIVKRSFNPRLSIESFIIFSFNIAKANKNVQEQVMKRIGQWKTLIMTERDVSSNDGRQSMRPTLTRCKAIK